MQQQRNNRPMIITVVIVVILAAILATIYTNVNNRRGELDVILQLQDTNGLSLKIDGQEQTVTDTQPVYALKPGDHTISISKSGYKDFSADFTIKNKETITINATMTRTEAGTPEVSSKAIVNVDIPGSTITESHYFYQKTWAVIHLRSPDGNTAWVVYRYDDDSSAWIAEAGPGTVFEQESLDGLPQSVVDFLTENNLVNGGVSE
jgi:hypothetical protein